MKRFLLITMCLVCALAVAAPAKAATLGLEYLVGFVAPSTPANPSDELVLAQNLIDWYNGGGGASIDPSIDTNGGANGDGNSPNPVIDYTYGLQAGSVVLAAGVLPDATGGTQMVAPLDYPVDLTGYTYLWAKFGPDGALYYLDGFSSLSGFLPETGPFSSTGHGLSGITLFGPGTTLVPEAGALIMFGTGLIGLIGYRRVRRMQ